MQPIELAVSCRTLFLGDRLVVSPRSLVGARRARAVHTLLGKHRLPRGPESGPLR